MKKYILTFLIGLCTYANAQDIIEFKKGDPIEAKVIEVNEKVLTYQIPMKSGDGPIYTVPLHKVNQIQYSNGMIEDFSRLTEEFADTDKAHLLEFNAIDLLFQRVAFNYEYFPSKDRNWSIQVPARMSFNYDGGDNHIYSYSPLLEAGVGANLYLLRKGKSNLHLGLEANYQFARGTQYYWDYWTGQSWTETFEKHFMGFYLNTGYKFNFRPRIGFQASFGLGWKYDLYSYLNRFQSKGDIGIFFRF